MIVEGLIGLCLSTTSRLAVSGNFSSSGTNRFVSALVEVIGNANTLGATSELNVTIGWAMSWLDALEMTNVVAHAVLVLCVVSIVGFAIAAIKIRGIGLGSAGVLFAGLIFGHFGWHIQHEVLDFAREFGLILFVFTIGLQIGPGFFASLQRQGLALNICAAAIVIGGAGLAAFTVPLLGNSSFEAAGLFSGSTTNTPSLGAAH